MPIHRAKRRVLRCVQFLSAEAHSSPAAPVSRRMTEATHPAAARASPMRAQTPPPPRPAPPMARSPRPAAAVRRSPGGRPHGEQAPPGRHRDPLRPRAALRSSHMQPAQEQGQDCGAVALSTVPPGLAQACCGAPAGQLLPVGASARRPATLGRRARRAQVRRRARRATAARLGRRAAGRPARARSRARGRSPRAARPRGQPAGGPARPPRTRRWPRWPPARRP